MSEFLLTIQEVNSAIYLEALAVLLAITYLLLAVREKIACWYAAFVSSALFWYIFLDVNLLMESALQIYYVAMAVYGWWQWRRGGQGGVELGISRWPLRKHALAILAVLLCGSISGYLLSVHSEARLPYVDSFTTWASVLTTWMVARKLIENWIYWLVIDSISIALYLDRELYLTAFLFGVYLIIVIFGWRSWHLRYRQQTV